MVHYTEITFLIAPALPWREILMVELAEIGYDSFVEGHTDRMGDTGELRAYIPTDRFDPAALDGLMALRDPHVSVSWTSQGIAPRNWNAEWERSFRPVEIDRDIRIRAEFHPSVPGFAHELIITPRMAFGTGHHATTRLMLRAMLPLDLQGKDVCDLGCGTGVLAFLAEQRGARHVLAVDNEDGAVDNARHNARLNGCERTIVEKGDASALDGRSFDLILANIERNVLLDAMPRFGRSLRPGGALFLGGFTPEDRHMLAQSAKKHGLVIAERSQDGDWALLGCRKPA
ncbi:MAG: 50S ribosomal protein L11 methyltransferase [Flavobacteriales bacterium]|jgi:ribosomal protein L11 methyltransferase|nr:50S ribosomal protein L11 methyltransferase [Flavobacteriales bacterium]